MPKHPLPKPIKKELSAYAKALSEAREATNAANRQKTALRNTIKAHWQANKMPVGSYVRSDGLEVKYEATETEIIDPERVMELYESNEITREQFLRMVSITKTDAKNILGGDQVAEFTTIKVGKTADVRVEALPVENVDDEYLMESSKMRRSVKTTRRKVRQPSEERVAAKKPRRRIKTRTKR